MDVKDLTPEQFEKVKGMSVEDLHKLAAEEGVTLSDEELEQVSGGWGGEDNACSAGGKHEWVQTDTEIPNVSIVVPIYTCTKCGATRRG